MKNVIANYPPAGKPGIARRLAIEHHCPGLPERVVWAESQE